MWNPRLALGVTQTRDDAEHERAARVADAVNDHALTAIADHGIFGFVVFEQPAVITADAVFCNRRRAP
jgi:hypothetical protein